MALFTPLSGLYDVNPVIEQDWGLHFHHLQSMQAFWRQDRALWGYNPLFMAGYPSNTIQDLSIKFFEFLALALAHIALTPIQWFKITVFLAMASVPWLMYGAARNLFWGDRLGYSAATAAAFLGTMYWWNSLPREMFFYGMVGFPAAAYTSMLGVGLLYRLIKAPVSWSGAYVAWLLFGIIILPLHIQSILILSGPALVLFVAQSRRPERRRWFWIIGAAVVAVAANFWWLSVAFEHRGNDVSDEIVRQLSLFVSSDPLTFLKDYLGPQGFWTFRSGFWEKGFRVMLAILGILTLTEMLRRGHREAASLLAAAAIVLFFLAYFGSLIPSLQGLQPLRFKVPLDLFLALAASYGVAGWLAAEPSTPRSRVTGALLFVGIFTFFINLIQTESQGRLVLRTRIAPEITAIVEWVRQNAPAGGRVLFEESGDETGFIYDGMYLSAFTAHWTGRQLIGGPINLYNDRHHFASFHSGQLFKRPIRTYSDDEIKAFFQLYNIGAIVAFHPASLQKLSSMPGFISLRERIGPVHLMTVSQPLGWTLHGRGKVDTRFNRLEVSEAGEDEIVLKYHWVDGLVSTPAAGIVPLPVHGSPIPFIKVIKPPASFTLSIAQ